MTVARRLARWLYHLLAAFGLITVLVISTPVVSWWARAYSGSIEQPRGDILILLSAAADDANGISYSSYWRARMAVLAWKTGSFKKIVISGGGGPGILNFLGAEGIPRDAMIAEWQSTSTRENAINTARLIRNMPGKRVLLTSDFHMYRAIRVFRKVGIAATPMAAPDVLHAAQHWTGRFSAFETMLLETEKIAYYRLRGWIVF
ncbi:MAG: YdcF family protein [Acidobacteriaceae bacterium]